MAQRPESRIVRILIARRRLMAAVAAGLILLLVLPTSYRTATRYLLAWDLTSAIYVAAALWMIARSTIQTCHARAALYDESDWAIITLVVASSAASFTPIFAELGAIISVHPPPIIILCVPSTPLVR